MIEPIKPMHFEKQKKRAIICKVLVCCIFLVLVFMSMFYFKYPYSYEFINNSLNLTYGDFDSYKNLNASNGINYSIGIDSAMGGFDLTFLYYYFNANGLSDLDDDGLVFSISKKTSF